MAALEVWEYDKTERVCGAGRGIARWGRHGEMAG